MDITCPACRKHNPNANSCARCGADLLLLVNICKAAQQALEQGRQYLKGDQGREALKAAKRSWQLKHSADAAGLAFMASLHQQQFDEASKWYQRAQDLSEAK
jgi:predicted amidophosphoribosyltransferase